MPAVVILLGFAVFLFGIYSAFGMGTACMVGGAIVAVVGILWEQLGGDT